MNCNKVTRRTGTRAIKKSCGKSFENDVKKCAVLFKQKTNKKSNKQATTKNLHKWKKFAVRRVCAYVLYFMPVCVVTSTRVNPLIQQTYACPSDILLHQSGIHACVRMLYVGVCMCAARNLLFSLLCLVCFFNLLPPSTSHNKPFMSATKCGSTFML